MAGWPLRVVRCGLRTNLLSLASVSSSRDPARCLAVPAAHSELPRRRGSPRRTRSGRLVRERAQLGVEIRADDRTTVATVPPSAKQLLASRRDGCPDCRQRMYRWRAVDHDLPGRRSGTMAACDCRSMRPSPPLHQLRPKPLKLTLPSKGRSIRVKAEAAGAPSRLGCFSPASQPFNAAALFRPTPCFIWSGRGDSNPRPQPWQGCALPLSYTRTALEEFYMIAGD